MVERGVEVDHSTLNRWVLKYVPLLETQFCARKRSVGSSWRLDETYVKVKGVWKYLYRAVDKAGATVDFLLTAKRDCKAALRFLRKAIRCNGTPEKITIDKSGANTAAIESYNTDHKAGIEMRQNKKSPQQAAGYWWSEIRTGSTACLHEFFCIPAPGFARIPSLSSPRRRAIANQVLAKYPSDQNSPPHSRFFTCGHR